MQDNCGLSVNLSQLPSATTPLHIVLWKGVDTANPTVASYTTEDTIKVLRDRISALEAMVSGLLETQKASQWFPSGLRPTPTGIEVVSRRESMGGESDMGAVLSQLVRPVDETRTVKVSVPAAEPMLEAEEAEEAEVIEAEEAEVEAEETEVQEEQETEVQEAEETEVQEEQETEVQEEAAQEGQETEMQEEQETEAQEEEEEVVEYKEIEWKGQTYYVDGNLEVYEMDSDGDLIEKPIGQWREATQKMVRYKSA